MRQIQVRAVRDAEAGVWVVESDDVPGLITEVERREDVAGKVNTLIGELTNLAEGACIR